MFMFIINQFIEIIKAKNISDKKVKHAYLLIGFLGHVFPGKAF